MQDWKTSAQIATALFVIADPAAAIPIFTTLTSGNTAKERKRIASVTPLTVATVLVSSIFLGQPEGPASTSSAGYSAWCSRQVR
jgi:multiple antibiotic resistance protein